MWRWPDTCWVKASMLVTIQCQKCVATSYPYAKRVCNMCGPVSVALHPPQLPISRPRVFSKKAQMMWWWPSTCGMNPFMLWQDSAKRGLRYTFHVPYKRKTGVGPCQWPCFHLNSPFQGKKDTLDLRQRQILWQWLGACWVKPSKLVTMQCLGSAGTSFLFASLVCNRCGPMSPAFLPHRSKFLGQGSSPGNNKCCDNDNLVYVEWKHPCLWQSSAKRGLPYPNHMPNKRAPGVGPCQWPSFHPTPQPRPKSNPKKTTNDVTLTRHMLSGTIHVGDKAVPR